MSMSNNRVIVTGLTRGTHSPGINWLQTHSTKYV